MSSARSSLLRGILSPLLAGICVGMLLLSGLSYWQVHRSLKALAPAPPVEPLASSVARQAALPILAVTPLFLIGAFFSVSRPLASLRRAQERMKSAHGPTPLPLADFPEEVSETASAFNQLLEEHEALILREKRYRSENAHKLRGALAILKIHAFNAAHLKDPQAQADSLQKLSRGIDGSTRLVDQLRSEVEMEDRLRRTKKESVDLKSLARKALLEIAPKALERAHELSFDAEGEDFCVKGEPKSLMLMIQNFAQNAIEAMRAGGRLSISLEEASSKILLKVQDTGCGIPPDSRDDVFKRFYRLKGQKKTGAGLGLSMVKRVADAHGAEIRLEPAAPEGGLRVVVLFQKA